MSDDHEVKHHLHKFEELSYFDDLGLFYLCRETPPRTLALVFLAGDPKITGSMLGILDPKRREYIHSLMSELREEPESDRKSALSGMLIIAENLILRNLVKKEGRFYYGVKKD